MIEISHKQAQRLLRRKMDTRLPDEQWAMLQAHLESCTECRSYGERLGRIEKDLRRALRSGIDSIPGPYGPIAESVAAARQRRAQFQQRAVQVGAVVLAVILFFAFRGPAWINSLLHPQPDSATPIPLAPQYATDIALRDGPRGTAIPTAQPGDFPDVVVYQARLDGKPNGNTQLYLLNPGAQPVDLSSPDFNDSDPAWSPDGEWIAYLSDRSGKPEVFVTNVAGNRQVQLTDAPDVTWQGPLSWSADGKNIALGGIRDTQGSQRWVYLVPLDGSGPLALAGTRGSSSPEFSPFGLRLAFTYDDIWTRGVKILHIDTNEQVNASWPENNLASPPDPGSALDWSADGTALAYVSGNRNNVPVTGPTPAPTAQSFKTPNDLSFQPQPYPGPQVVEDVHGSQIMAVRDLNYSISQFYDFSHNFLMADSRWPSAFRAVTWSPSGSVVYLEENTDDRANDQPGTQKGGGCWTVHSRVPGSSDRDGVFSVGSLCVDGGLDRGSWSADNRWLVVLGHQPGQTRRGLYAIRMPGRPFGILRDPTSVDGTPVPRGAGGRSVLPSTKQPGEVLSLANDPYIAALPRVRPRPRFSNQALAINPRPVKPAANIPYPTSDLSQRAGGPAGQIVYSVQNNSVSVAVSANPNGTGGRVISSSDGLISCTRLSPDGQNLALIERPFAHLPEGTGGGTDLAPGAGGTTGGSGTVDAAATGDQFSLNENIYAMSVTGEGRQQVSSMDNLPDGINPPVMMRYDCPVWSPQNTAGGPYLAALMATTEGTYLTVMPVTQPAAPRYLRVYGTLSAAGPAWSADGKNIYLAVKKPGQSALSLMAVYVPADPKAVLSSYTVTDLSMWTTLHGLAAAPQGDALAVIALGKENNDLAMAEISPIDSGAVLESPDNSGPTGVVSLAETRILGQEYTRAPALHGALAWLPGDGLGVILRGKPNERVKARILRYDLGSRRAVPLAEIPDTLYDAAWSPDGSYVLFSTESGLWGLDVNAALTQHATPIWLSPQPVQDLDWR